VQTVVLDQNVPNPFAEQTAIRYELPVTVQRAQLLFYDAQGRLIKAVDIAERGQGQLTVFANDLSNGIYTYALVADGQVMDSKKMVKQD
jgi:trimeric autotransporter adhesin